MLVRFGDFDDVFLVVVLSEEDNELFVVDEGELEVIVFLNGDFVEWSILIEIVDVVEVLLVVFVGSSVKKKGFVFFFVNVICGLFVVVVVFWVVFVVFWFW